VLSVKEASVVAYQSSPTRMRGGKLKAIGTAERADFFLDELSRFRR